MGNSISFYQKFAHDPTDLAEIWYVGTPWGSIHLCTVSA